MHSVNEVTALLRKAAIGAGVPQGHAEELAALAAVSRAHDEAFWTDVLIALKRPLSRVAPVLDGHVLHYVKARAICDGIDAIDAAICGQEVHVTEIDAPLVFERQIRRAERQFQTALLSAHRDGGFILRATPLSQALAPDDLLMRLELPGSVQEALLDLAARTYVPATDLSRAAGAGAGLDDND